MPRVSLDSERPIMAPSLTSGLNSKRASMRMSTYSASPSFQSDSTLSTETGMQEIRCLTRGLQRLENKPLAEQRFVPSEQKNDNMSKLALGAKLERALGRRMANQDAVMPQRKKKMAASPLVPMTEKSTAIRA